MTEPEHLGDLLSALVDGELDAADEAQARAHLAGCAWCQAELTWITEGRDAVRGLPAVEPPFGFYERMHLRRRPGWWQRGVGAVAAGGVAAVLLVNVLAPKPESVEPKVTDLVQTHAASASVAGDPLSNLVPAGVPVSFRP